MHRRHSSASYGAGEPAGFICKPERILLHKLPGRVWSRPHVLCRIDQLHRPRAWCQSCTKLRSSWKVYPTFFSMKPTPALTVFYLRPCRYEHYHFAHRCASARNIVVRASRFGKTVFSWISQCFFATGAYLVWRWSNDAWMMKCLHYAAIIGNKDPLP